MQTRPEATSKKIRYASKVALKQGFNSLSLLSFKAQMSLRRFMSFVSMAFLWIGSQIPVYFFGGIPPLIYADIGGADRWVWFVCHSVLPVQVNTVLTLNHTARSSQTSSRWLVFVPLWGLSLISSDAVMLHSLVSPLLLLE